MSLFYVTRDRALKWEDGQVPLGSSHDRDIHNMGECQATVVETQPKTFRSRALKWAKIVLPHVGLTSILVGYIVLVALIIQRLEYDVELNRRREKVLGVSHLYSTIANNSYRRCLDFREKPDRSGDFDDWQKFVREELMSLSELHEFDIRQPVEEQKFSLDPDDIKSRWTLEASILYALTILTTTGYDHVTPQTDLGKLLTVFFGLLGIPLMFITAADIGKFLSETFKKAYGKLVKFYRFLRQKLQLNKSKLAEGEQKRLSCLRDFDADDFSDEESGGRLELPLLAYFGLILSYCSIGGLLYTSWETGPIWSFAHAFHFSFNTITTISLGNILVSSPLYLVLIVLYVIIGLAVVTMCVDLASSQLKLFFTKLHYFGRTVRGAKDFMSTMSDDIKEAMRLISHIRRMKPNQTDISLDDVKHFLEMQQLLLQRPYIPRNIQLIRYVDEDDRSNSTLSLNLANGPTHPTSNPLCTPNYI